VFRPAASVYWSALLGFWLWPAAMLCWEGVQIILGGRFGLLAEGALGVMLGALIGFLIVFLGRPWKHHDALRFGFVMLFQATTAFVALLFLLGTGPADLKLYPPPEESLYRLPYPAGRTYLCCQGNRAIVSHRKPHELYAYDFAMPLGADICAARGGLVTAVEDRNDGNGLNAPNNYVQVFHPDRQTFAEYHHIRKGGSYVQVGDFVYRGQVIAACGNVGMSLMPHVHFQVLNMRGLAIPVTFEDVPGDGIPRMFCRYTSGNNRP
jgi:hypothetical protein